MSTLDAVNCDPQPHLNLPKCGIVRRAGNVLCGWLPRCKDYLTVQRPSQVRSCVRPVTRCYRTAGPDGIRGSGPYLLCGLEHPRPTSGCPDPRSDRFAITSHRPRNRRRVLRLRTINSSCGSLRCRSVRAIDLATGHDDPCDARRLVGHGHGDQLVGFADQQVGDPGVSVGFAPRRLKL